jgi:tRNA (guanine37-N1)-methyltransferase
MKIVVITLFPEMFSGVLSESILKRAQEKGLFKVEFINLRNFGFGNRRQVDDTPYGGGVGMVLRVDVMAKAVEAAKKLVENPKLVLLTPQGTTYKQAKAAEFASRKQDLILIAGHYEGFDERIRSLADEQISVGDYVLTGGEIPAMVIIDSVARLLPGVLGKAESSEIESHSIEGVLEYPQYTRPEDWQGQKVPEVLLSGNHQKIEEWRKNQSQSKSQ